jgi:hypothetical protein
MRRIGPLEACEEVMKDFYDDPLRKNSTLGPDHLAELRRIAIDLVEHKKWDELPWGQAWGGKYPDSPTEAEIEAELNILKPKAVRMMRQGAGEEDYCTIEEHRRTISLEFSDVFLMS